MLSCILVRYVYKPFDILLLLLILLPIYVFLIVAWIPIRTYVFKFNQYIVNTLYGRNHELMNKIY